MNTSKVATALFPVALSAVLTAQQPGLPLRCGFQAAATSVGTPLDHPDCDYNQTNPSAAYAPTSLLRIPVVVHVIQNTSGTGNLSNAIVQSQITVLNEDYRAISGTPGAGGTDAMVEFFLATTDPNGQPTTGIVHYTNNTWFSDTGSYYNSIAWPTSRYLNIYTNSAGGGGVLGYVPDLPQGGSVLGTNADRVVILYSAFGRPSPLAPFDRGRTATHEVGHYLGLFHTFQGGCGSASCYTTGDRICDTNAESSAHFGCPGSASSCGTPDPFHNYMDYTDDTCMTNFTPEQVRRIRCTLQYYRPQLAQPAGPLASAASRSGAGNANSAFSATAPHLGQNASMNVVTILNNMNAATVVGYLSPATSPFQGQTILVDVASPQILLMPFQVNSIVCTWSYAVPVDPSFAGLPISAQGVMFDATSFRLTNAMDLMLGN